MYEINFIYTLLNPSNWQASSAILLQQMLSSLLACSLSLQCLKFLLMTIHTHGYVTSLKQILNQSKMNSLSRNASAKGLQISQSSDGVASFCLVSEKKRAVAKIVKILSDMANMPNFTLQNWNYEKEILISQFKVEHAIQKPQIQAIMKDEFKLEDAEIASITRSVIDRFKKITNRQDFKPQPQNSSSFKMTDQNYNTLSLAQRKELEHLGSIDYSRQIAQPGVKSLYLLSKIAETLHLQIIIPPTILIGFSDDTRLMHNDPQNGHLIVKKGLISPAMIGEFVTNHMSVYHMNQSIEDQLAYPKFVIRSATSNSSKNDVRVYFSKESMLQDAMGMWGSSDMAIQLFVKQKHLRRSASIMRYYSNKNGHVYKATVINAKNNFDKYSRVCQGLVEEYRQKQTQIQKVQEQSKPNVLRKSSSLTRVKQEPVNNIKVKLANHQTAPATLENFPLLSYFEVLQRSFLSNDLVHFFTTSFNEENIENISLIPSRPGAFPQAEKMSNDLFRLFSSYYFKQPQIPTKNGKTNTDLKKMFLYNQYANIQMMKKISEKFCIFVNSLIVSNHIQQFVCDFIEGDNGMVYLIQIKAIETSQDEITHAWNPSTAYQTLQKIEEQDQITHSCDAQLICQRKKPYQDDLLDLFNHACEQIDYCKLSSMKPLRNGNYLQPVASKRLLDRYRKELFLGEETFCLPSEKSRICPLYPLTCFPDKSALKDDKLVPTQTLQKSSNYTSKRNSIIMETPPLSLEESPLLKRQHTILPDIRINCCLACCKLLEMYSLRTMALVFKTELVMEELKKLKLKLITHWRQEDFAFIVRLYKDSANKSSAALAAKAITDLDKLSRRQHARELRERSTTKESVAEKGTSNIMAWNQYKTIDTLSFQSKRASSVERLRQAVNPTLTTDKVTRAQSPLTVQRTLEPGNNQSLQQPLKSSRSLRRLIEERKVFIKGTTSPPKSPKQQHPLPAVKQEEAKIKLISFYGDLKKRPPSKLKSRNPPMIIPPANPIFSTEAQVQKSYFNIQSAYAPLGRKKQMLLRNKSKDLVVI